MSKQQKKLEPFIEGKVRLWYRLTNKNKSGFMTKSDFNDMAEAFISEFKLDEATGKEIRSWLVDGWESLITYAKASAKGKQPLVSEKTTPLTLLIAEKISKGDQIDEDLYINAFHEVLKMNEDVFKVVFSQMVSAFFNIYDTDKDGLITETDMIRGLKCFGIDQSEALKEVFAELDSTGSGKVDRDSYVGAWVEFMCGTKEDAPMAKHLNPAILYPPQSVKPDKEASQ